MSAVNPPFVIQASTHPSDVFRRMVKALAEATSGVIAPADLAVTAHGGTMSVDVAAGQAIVQGTENSITQGSYAVTNDAVVTLAIAAADPTNPRNDLVIAKVQDATYSGATNAWSLVVVTGTPAGSPVDPAVPNNAIKLARVVVPANGTPVVAGWIADLRPFLYNSANPIGTTGAALGVPNAALGTSIGRWTTNGAPTAATYPYTVGMYGNDGSGMLWICTAAGSPGTWKSAPMLFKASAFRNAALNHTANGAWQTIILDTADYDTNSNFNLATGVWTCPAAGIYAITGGVQFGWAPAAGSREGVRINKNAAALVISLLNSGLQTINGSLTVSRKMQLAVNDTIRLDAFQETGASQALGVGSGSTFLDIQYLSAV